MADCAKPPTIDDLRRVWPDLAGGRIETVAEGAANHVLLVDDDWVVRVPRNGAARADLEREAAILALLPRHVDLPVPASEIREGMMRQRRLHGRPLDRHTLLRQTPATQERLAEAIAHFLFQLHRVPPDELRHARVGDTPASVGTADAQRLFADVEREIFPHLKPYARNIVLHHFGPVLEGRLSLDYEPVLIHADLSPSHLLWDPERGRLVGVLDFGMAGFGDSAVDYAFVILAYGETPLRRMHLHHPGIGAKIDRARFWALAMELQYILSALRTREPRWIVGHVGSARDLLPIGTPWA